MDNSHYGDFYMDDPYIFVHPLFCMTVIDIFTE